MNGLNRSLGLPMLIFYGMGMILGAGIYSIIGKAAAQTGDTLWAGFLLAGVAAFLTALSYAELSTMFPKAGAEFVYLRETFKSKKWIGSTAGIAMAFSGAATAATVSLAFAEYFNKFVEFPHAAVALGVLLAFTAIAIIGIRTSGWATVVSTLIEVGGLVFIIYLGLSSEKFGKVLAAAPHFGTLSGSALIIFSFFGFESIVNLAEEAKNPERDLPRAILVSVILSTILYVLVSLSALALLSSEQLAASDTPLMSVALAVSEKYGQVLGAIALFSTANTALISLIGGSRIIYSMGEARVLPSIVASVLPKRKTPWIASLAILVVAVLLLPLGKIEMVASLSSFATLIAFFSVNVALIVLRFTQKNKKRSFRISLSIGRLPILPLLGALASLALATQFDLNVYVIGIPLIALSAFFFIWKTRKFN